MLFWSMLALQAAPMAGTFDLDQVRRPPEHVTASIVPQCEADESGSDIIKRASERIAARNVGLRKPSHAYPGKLSKFPSSSTILNTANLRSNIEILPLMEDWSLLVLFNISYSANS